MPAEMPAEHLVRMCATKRRSSQVVPIVFRWLAPISSLTIVGGLLFSATVGKFVGPYPARKARRLDPIEACRYEQDDSAIYRRRPRIAAMISTSAPALAASTVPASSQVSSIFQSMTHPRSIPAPIE
jgi:hypothetical protein